MQVVFTFFFFFFFYVTNVTVGPLTAKNVPNPGMQSQIPLMLILLFSFLLKCSFICFDGSVSRGRLELLPWTSSLALSLVILFIDVASSCKARVEEMNVREESTLEKPLENGGTATNLFYSYYSFLILFF